MHEGKKVCSFGPDSPYVDLAAEVFRMLADPTRIRIILALREGEQSVGGLAEVVGKSATTVSQHLAKLRWGRVVAARQDGTRVYYRLQDDRARSLVALAVAQAEHALDEESAHRRAGVSVEGLPGSGGGRAADGDADDESGRLAGGDSDGEVRA
ncbi:ArsR/SmtB family transcription factor [Allonocardiopsis opalescens]|uniref:ArsR family transcriptional regulator n=1 Tax=Allonocardiopsis opalescens TaxID=1144618 RepID=A0A2T0Q2R2_9ACTN|nr:metalloregulator ArsR/SmtB family transcription factor [Allonocardiopsis opalescens]PRX97958.1 ArsR family transcriptional regulator [Allonocardiopsis opalescens]